jgi:hypothetical protein
VAARDLAAFAFIPPGKKNSRGARRLRQIEVGYNMLPQVRRGVTERRPAYVAARPTRRCRNLSRTRPVAARSSPASTGPNAINGSAIHTHTRVPARKHLFRSPLRPHLRGAGHRIQIDHECGTPCVDAYATHMQAGKDSPTEPRPPARDRAGRGRQRPVPGLHRRGGPRPEDHRRGLPPSASPIIRSAAGRHDVTSCR